jgi:hypothetical protein
MNENEIISKITMSNGEVREKIKYKKSGVYITTKDFTFYFEIDGTWVTMNDYEHKRYIRKKKIEKLKLV